MKQLTEYQINFILDKFFISDEYPNSKNIGEKLLTKGTCIVAGTKPISLIGVTPYITTESIEDLVDCVKYNFDLDGFINSTLFKSAVENQKRKYEKNKEKLINEYVKNLENLNKEYDDISKF